MAVSYKRLQHLMIDRDVSNAELMRRAKISANIITDKGWTVYGT